MRRLLIGLSIALGCSASVGEARAQFGSGLNDPFFAYYSFYLPRQQAQANSPGPEATINAITANRQQYAATNRSDMFDPNASGGFLDENGDFGLNPGTRRRAAGAGVSRHGGNLGGLGPAGYFNKPNQYHPTVRAGRGRNANTSAVRSRGIASGGGANGLGLPGPR